MPIRTQTTELLKFGFDSKQCKTYKASSENDKNLLVRLRKRDMKDILDNTSYDSTQMYVRADQDKPLMVQPGQNVLVKIKNNELIFKVNSMHVLTSLAHRPRFVRTAILSGSFS